MRFGDSSLDFEARFFLADLFDGLAVRNELRLQIFERLREEGIEIPYPQRSLRIRMEGPESDILNVKTAPRDKPAGEMAVGEPAPEAAKAAGRRKKPD